MRARGTWNGISIAMTRTGNAISVITDAIYVPGYVTMGQYRLSDRFMLFKWQMPVDVF